LKTALRGKSCRRRTIWSVGAAVTFAVLAYVPPYASADSQTGSPGNGPGQYESPKGLVVDPASEELFVADAGNDEIDVFSQSGAYLRSFGSEGTGAGQFDEPESIALDGEFLYVYDRRNFRVQKLELDGNFVWMVGDGVNLDTGEDLCEAGESCGSGVGGTGGEQFPSCSTCTVRLDIGPGGVLHSVETIAFSISTGFESRLRRYSSSGELLTGCPLLPEGSGRVQGAAVLPSGDFYAAKNGEEGAARRYEATCGFASKVPPSTGQEFSFNISALSLDGAGNLFVSDLTGTDHIAEYDSSETLQRILYGEAEYRTGWLAPNPGVEGGLFLVDAQTGGLPQAVIHLEFPEPGPTILPYGGFAKADPVSNTKATLNARIDPQGEATGYHFEYVEEALCEEDEEEGGECFDSATRAPEDEEDDPALSAGFGLKDASLQIGCPAPTQELIDEGKCLTPETRYRFRALASNADGDAEPVEGLPFETKASLEILDTWATEVGADSARLAAEVNPLGVPATAFFEYVAESAYEADLGEGGDGFSAASRVPAEGSELDLGASEEPTEASTPLQGLGPGASYRYRVVAANAFVEIAGPARQIHTFAASVASEYDCDNQALRSGAGALLPDCRAHEMVSPLDKGGADLLTLPNVTGYESKLEKSGASGNKIAYSSATAFGDAISSPYTSQYIATRTGGGWSTHGISPPREGGSFSAMLDSQFKAFTEDLRYGWLVHDTEPQPDPEGVPGFNNLHRRDNQDDSYEAQCPVEPPAGTLASSYEPEPQGVTQDGAHLAFRAPAELHEDAAEVAGAWQLYLCSEGTLRLISQLPDGEADGDGASLGTANGTPGFGVNRRGNVATALSADGQTAYWTDNDKGVGSLYVRVNAGAEPSALAGEECAEPAKACTLVVSPEARFRAAAADGARAIVSSGGTLLEFDLAKALAGEEALTPIASEVTGFMGASADATHAYFASREALGGENSEEDEAVAGAPNLYLRDGAGEVHFVGTLSEDDARVNEIQPEQSPILTPVSNAPFNRSSRVAADGRHAAFTSSAELTGYDNGFAEGSPAGCGEQEGACEAEVFLYDADEGQLLCASCNPGGGRPRGENITESTPRPFWAAAHIPGWESQLNASRALSADGRRLFFEAADSLVLHDTNGASDVYQWEAVGKGDCDPSKATFSAQAQGCIGLISGAESSKGASLLDASADGRDVFFKTDAGLWPGDEDLIDIYDARIGGGFPPPPEPERPCEGEACQIPEGAPEDPTPGSAFLGPPAQGPTGPPVRRPCLKAAGRAKRNSDRAKRLRRAARRADSPRATKRMRRAAKRSAKRAGRLSSKAKRCRRARGNGRARR
jgi:hypothetical protein